MKELQEIRERVENVFERLNLLSEAIRQVDTLEDDQAQQNVKAAASYWLQAADEAAQIGIALAQIGINVGLKKRALAEMLDVPATTFRDLEKTT